MENFVADINGLPQLPKDLEDEIYISIEENKNVDTDAVNIGDIYTWIPCNDKLQNWCKENISKDVYWAIQVITDDLPIHEDADTEVKFLYVIQGKDAVTRFYDKDFKELNSQVLELREWYILNTSVFHNVTDVNKTRIAITGRILP